MLGTPRARVNAPAFAAAWMLSIFVVGAIAIAIAGGTGAVTEDQTSNGASTLKVVFGVLLLLLAVKTWRKRPAAGEPAKTPGWMNAVDKFTAARAAALAAGLSVINPKNLVLVISAAGAIASMGDSAAAKAGELLVFTLIATIGVGVPVILYFVMGERSQPPLDRLKTWMIGHNAVIMTVICALIGAALIAQGTGELR